MSVRHRPPSVVDRIRCDACGMWNDPKITPSGGEYRSNTTWITQSGTSVIRVDEGLRTGCCFCDCPDWNRGGSLGDMK